MERYTLYTLLNVKHGCYAMALTLSIEITISAPLKLKHNVNAIRSLFIYYVFEIRCQFKISINEKIISTTAYFECDTNPNVVVFFLLR